MSASTITPYQARLTVAFAADKGWVKFPTRTMTDREVDEMLTTQRKTTYRRKARHAQVDPPRPEGA